MKPASGLCPKCWANAIVLRSTDTNIAPSKKYTGASKTSPGAGAPRPRELLRCQAAAADRAPPGPRGPGAASGATMTGSVPRWAANQSVPATHSRAATPTPEAGKTSVASSVTAAGPITKQSSSATDSKLKAACSLGEPASRTLQRVRTIVPRDGMAEPAIAPGAKNAQVGRCSSTAAISAAVARANTVSKGSSTRR
jgi:hypothetical protein